jgi:hypothetical protein
MNKSILKQLIKEEITSLLEGLEGPVMGVDHKKARSEEEASQLEKQGYQRVDKRNPSYKYRDEKGEYIPLLKKMNEGEDETGIRNMVVHSIGHVDDEPDMLKQYAYDIVKYGTTLYKILSKLDNMDHMVDLPNWLQANIIKARENVSKAAHYLEYELSEPSIDMALAEKKKKFPDLTGDGKVTRADILKGRGVKLK